MGGGRQRHPICPWHEIRRSQPGQHQATDGRQQATDEDVRQPPCRPVPQDGPSRETAQHRQRQVEGDLGREAPGLGERAQQRSGDSLSHEEMWHERLGSQGGLPPVDGCAEYRGQEDTGQREVVAGQQARKAVDGVTPQIRCGELAEGRIEPGPAEEEATENEEHGHAEVTSRSEPAEEARVDVSGPVGDVRQDHQERRHGTQTLHGAVASARTLDRHGPAFLPRPPPLTPTGW